MGFGSRDLHAHPCPRGAQIWARKLEFSKIDQNQACMYSTCRSQCPEHQDNFLFEIGLKLTELRVITRCPYMVASANFGYFCAIKWPNLNIFQWDLKFYMISTLELRWVKRQIFANWYGGTALNNWYGVVRGITGAQN